MKTDSSAVMSHGREVKGQVYWPRIEEEEREAEKPQTTQAELQIQERFWMKQTTVCSYIRTQI